MDRDKLLELINDDHLGLLKVKPKQSAAMSADERLAESFYEIVDFYKANEREPIDDMGNIQEYRLAMRLANLRQNEEKMKELADLDEFGLLVPSKKVESIDDILGDDDLDILGGGAGDDIFTLKHVQKDIESPDYIAQRQPCKDFKKYEHLFTQCHADLRDEKRTLLPFANEQQIQEGNFFILKGVMAYVQHVGEREKRGGKMNARLHCIFENGTESDMLLRSLARELYKDGRRVSDHNEELLEGLEVAEEDSQTGFVYVLKSLCPEREISSISDLYKIGFSTVPVEDRIKNADKEPTYLCAPVKIVEVFTCYNLNPQKMEALLHRFFGNVCLDIEIRDRDGKRFTPREWFIAPLPVIEEAVRLLITGDIAYFYYDTATKVIMRK